MMELIDLDSLTVGLVINGWGSSLDSSGSSSEESSSDSDSDNKTSSCFLFSS